MSKEAGLIFGRRFENKGSEQSVALKGYPSSVSQEGLTWLHMDYESPETIQWVRECSGIDENLADYLLEDDSRPGILVHGQQLILVLRAINFNEKEDADDLISIRCYITDHLILTLRRRKVRLIEKMRKTQESGNGFINSSDFIYEMIDLLIQEIGKHTASLDEKMTELEDRLEIGYDPLVFDEATEAQRKLLRLRRFLHPQKSTIQQLLSVNLAWFDPDLRLSLHNLSELHTRYVEDLDYNLDRARFMKEEIAAFNADTTNKRLYLLALVSVVFLPLSLITGLLGVNLAGIPFADQRYAFAALCLGMLGIAGILLLNFKKKQWF
jgi:zinc transporter